MKPIDWVDIRQKVIAGLIISAILGGVGASGALLWSLSSNGAVVRTLGGLTVADAAQFAKIDELKLDVVRGGKLDKLYRNSDGSFFSYVDQDMCKNIGVLIGGYCGISDDGTQGANGNLQRVGLSPDHVFRCTWNQVSKPELFKASTEAVCLTIAKK